MSWVSKIWQGYKGWVITGIITLLGSGTVYIGTLVYNDLDIVKTNKANTIKINELDSIRKVDEAKIVFLMKYIIEEKRQKESEYQVGLRMRTTNNKLYYRDKHREYREVFHGSTGDYYRGENDEKVYINDRY